MKKIKQELNDLISRGLDSNVRIAVTGLSRAGKTAFITSLVNQLTFASTHENNLPLLYAARDGRLIGAKRVPQANMLVPRFAYDEALSALHCEPPRWPEPTRDVSEVRLSLKYKPTKRYKKLVSQSSVIDIDIIDYPGEWLLDLPLLNLSFHEWSQEQLQGLKGKRLELAKDWLSALEALDLHAEQNENQLKHISECYTQHLHQCKQAGLHYVQPGRFVLPGELEGAPVLQFFPCQFDGSEKMSGSSNLAMLKRRYEEYQHKVVKVFYKHHFATFDRQIVLVDCLQPLNTGHEAFHDMRSALEQVMKSFRYGHSNVLKRLFYPKIDKVLFAATKADHITPEQHTNLVSLLRQLVHPAWQTTSYENIDMNCISLASIKTTQSGFIQTNNETNPAIQGISLEGDSLTVFPGEVPAKLPSEEYWQRQGFEFTSFRPRPQAPDTPLEHIRVDKALEYLIGDKLK
ncbi:YcjX family protein [Vibrio sp. S4M6]|uniref:YcjX family protein n=1 Tax=Vibrio sinus TaxID=2946865 RepID=UPI002029D475|nr:YcjX family protein [Vibrio sinus]MCL9781159.1 YcjX family protein [Vibrio sinus]